MSGGRKNTDDILKLFTQEVGQIFGNEVVSIILFGSAATEEFVAGRSDFNCLVVLSEKAIDKLDKAQPLIARWQKQKISVPLFLTTSYIQASLDSFPVEFFNMAHAYRVLQGEDVLKDINIEKADLRLQCERELKGNLLKLRQGYLETGGKVKPLRMLIVQSIVAFASIFKALLFLKGKTVPSKRQDVFLAACREFKMDEGLFSVLLAVKANEAKLTKDQLANTVKRYIKEIEKISSIVDELKI